MNKNKNSSQCPTVQARGGGLAEASRAEPPRTFSNNYFSQRGANA